MSQWSISIWTCFILEQLTFGCFTWKRNHMPFSFHWTGTCIMSSSRFGLCIAIKEMESGNGNCLEIDLIILKDFCLDPHCLHFPQKCQEWFYVSFYRTSLIYSSRYAGGIVVLYNMVPSMYCYTVAFKILLCYVQYHGPFCKKRKLVGFALWPQ